MTLVEVVVSVALLSIVLLFLSGVFLTSFDLLGMAGRSAKNGNRAAAGIEMKTAGGGAADNPVQESAGAFTITFHAPDSDVTAQVNGSYILDSASEGKNGRVDYKSFLPEQ